MPQLKRLILVFIIALFLILGTGFLLAFESAPAPKTAAAMTAHETWPIMRHDNGHTGYNANVGSFRPPLAFFDTIELKTDSEIQPKISVWVFVDIKNKYRKKK